MGAVSATVVETPLSVESPQGMTTHTLWLGPGDIPIATTDLCGAVMLALVEGSDVQAVADRGLTTVERHQALRALRADLAATPLPWPRRLLIYRRSDDAAGGTSDEATPDTMVNYGATSQPDAEGALVGALAEGAGA